MDYIGEEAQEGLLLRQILRQIMGVSYSSLKSAKWDQRILLDGTPCPVDRRVSAGQCVTWLPPEDHPLYQLKPCGLPVRIFWMDDDLIVTDKPAPLASQSSLGHPDDSLENVMFSYFGCPDDYLYRPVNRLDKGTSGLMIIARSSYAQHRLQQLLHTAAFRRMYLAVTEGCPSQEEGTIDAHIAKADEASIRRIISADGKPSITHYKVLESRNHRALIELELETGRTHQIRVHLSSIGCPVVGDFLYGNEDPALPGRFALHSHRIILEHPITHETLDLTSPMPPELLRLLDQQHASAN